MLHFLFNLKQLSSGHLVDEVLLDDGVGWDPVGSVAGREGAPLEDHYKVGNMEISFQETSIINYSSLKDTDTEREKRKMFGSESIILSYLKIILIL